MKSVGKFLTILLIVGTGVVAYDFRAVIRDWWFGLNTPKLPAAQKFTRGLKSAVGIGGEQNSPVEGGLAKSKNFILISTPPSTAPAVKLNPFEAKQPLPQAINLDVPFTSQAPYQVWDLPYQETCEEAAALMVDAFYRGVSGQIPPDQAKQAIDDLIAFQTKQYGDYKDTNAQDTARFIKDYFHYQDVSVTKLVSVDQIKRALANGYPVLIPVSGKQLGNPNYKHGGPPYHMLVIKGYTQGRFITNDSGTRKGADYTYAYETVMRSAHDWNGGNVLQGQPMLIVVLPNK